MTKPTRQQAAFDKRLKRPFRYYRGLRVFEPGELETLRADVERRLAAANRRARRRQFWHWLLRLFRS